MRVLLTGGRIWDDGRLSPGDVLLTDGSARVFPPSSDLRDVQRVPVAGLVLFPGFADVHVHLREPGFSYKETIYAGSRRAARAGVTALCAMPNLNPAPDCIEHLQIEEELIARDALVRVYPYGTLTRGGLGQAPLADIEGMAGRVVAFTDDGHGVEDERVMRECMERVKAIGGLVCAHCEDVSYAPDDPRREFKMLERDLRIALETGCKYHACHLSRRESIQLMRDYKQKGADVTCETAPHYLLLSDIDRRDEGKYKMNPPLGTREDRRALLEGALDGTIDMIATDHAPHSKEEKSRGYEKSLNGVAGLGYCFPALYGAGILPLTRLVEMLSAAPAKRFGLDLSGDIAAFDLRSEYALDPGGLCTPFEGRTVKGRCMLTTVKGEIVWRAQD